MMKILIVDDNSFNLLTACDLLKKSGIDAEVLTCESGSEALKIIENNAPIDLVLLDIIMPGMDGLETLKKIKSNPITKNIHVLMFSSLTDKSMLEQCFNFGAIDYINKPIEPVEFIARIKSAITIKKTLDKIESQNVELNKLNKKLEKTQDYLVQKEKMISIGKLAAGVAHEINNPIGYISGNMETLKKYVNNIIKVMEVYENSKNDCYESSEEAKAFIDIIEENKTKYKVDFIISDVDSLFEESFIGINKVTSIVQSLRNFARQDSLEDMQLHSLNDIVKESIVIAHNETKHSAEINKDLDENLPSFFCNRSQIGQVLLNLIINSSHSIKSKYKDEQKGKIKLKTYSIDNYVVFEIEDNGLGIPKEIKNNIFTPFFSTKEVGKGTGLGLSISYDIIVNKHKGKILVDSEEGQGAKFTVKFPSLN